MVSEYGPKAAQIFLGALIVVPIAVVVVRHLDEILTASLVSAVGVVASRVLFPREYANVRAWTVSIWHQAKGRVVESRASAS